MNSFSKVVENTYLGFSISISFSHTSLPPISILYIAFYTMYPSEIGTHVVKPSPLSKTAPLINPSAYMVLRGDIES